MDYNVFDQVLLVAVTNGGVDYPALRKQKGKLDAFLKAVSKQEISALKTKSEQLAFYINAYNAHVLAMVRDRPKLTNVIKVKGFFDGIQVDVAGNQMTLNELEGRARALGDPRVHFAVNCASGSCPVLENTSFRPATMEARLEAATTRYLKDKVRGLKLVENTKTIELSKIFKWYSKDFAKSGEKKDILHWIGNQLGGDLGKKLKKGDYKVTWKTYDWELNSKK